MLTPYNKLQFKIPKEAPDYQVHSKFVVKTIGDIISFAISDGKNQIRINTNLRYGLPMENINKIAGPFVEAWACETFENILTVDNNPYSLIHVEARSRLNMADVLLQFVKQRTPITANVDVKATAEDIAGSGKSPNITSFGRIRSKYVTDPDFMFIILSIKHKVYSEKDKRSDMMNGIMEVCGHNTYDLKNISAADLSYNPALGTGQLQVRDIHYVEIEERTTWEFCQMIDQKYIASKKGYASWCELAVKNNWIK